MIPTKRPFVTPRITVITSDDCELICTSPRQQNQGGVTTGSGLGNDYANDEPTYGKYYTLDFDPGDEPSDDDYPYWPW